MKQYQRLFISAAAAVVLILALTSHTGVAEESELRAGAAPRHIQVTLHANSGKTNAESADKALGRAHAYVSTRGDYVSVYIAVGKRIQSPAVGVLEIKGLPAARDSRRESSFFWFDAGGSLREGMITWDDKRRMFWLHATRPNGGSWTANASINEGYGHLVYRSAAGRSTK